MYFSGNQFKIRGFNNCNVVVFKPPTHNRSNDCKNVAVYLKLNGNLEWLNFADGYKKSNSKKTYATAHSSN